MKFREMVESLMKDVELYGEVEVNTILIEGEDVENEYLWDYDGAMEGVGK